MPTVQLKRSLSVEGSLITQVFRCEFNVNWHSTLDHVIRFGIRRGCVDMDGALITNSDVN